MNVEELAAAKRLSVAWLKENAGIEDRPGGGVVVPYWDETREHLFDRLRDVPGRDRFDHPKGTKTRAYGLWRLAEKNGEAELFLAEGESDAWALWTDGRLALGVPGWANARVLEAEHLVGIDRVYCVPDNDDAGEKFLDGVMKRLGELGYAGRLLRVMLPKENKDISDFRCLDTRTFHDRLGGLVRAAVEVPLPRPASDFGEPINVADLRSVDPVQAWLWKGFVARGEVTLFSALWKAGKTTMLAHMVKAFQAGGTFLDYPVQKASVLYVTEESQSRWAGRRDELHLAGDIDFLVRPFPAKPRAEQWLAFVAHVKNLAQAKPYDVVVFDTLANLWPVRDENDASAVQAALMPLHGIVGDCTGERQPALFLVHHTRKSDGVEATASRGSGALPGFVDTILEFRRFNAAALNDRKRVLSGYGRHDETPNEMVIELSAQGCYSSCGGSRSELKAQSIGEVLLEVLPSAGPGMTVEQVLSAWPDESKPRREHLVAALREGNEDGRWVRSGEGRKGSPFVYSLAPTNPFVGPP